MKALDYIHGFKPYSREKLGEASRSEIRRWFDQGAIQVNGERSEWNEKVEDWTNGVFSLVLFPNGKRVTLL